MPKHWMSALSLIVWWFGLAYTMVANVGYRYGASYFLGELTQVPLDWKSLLILRTYKWTGKENQESWCGSSAISWEADVQLVSTYFTFSSIFLLLRVPTRRLIFPGGCVLSRRKLGCGAARGAARQRARIKHGGALSSCFDPNQPLLAEQGRSRE